MKSGLQPIRIRAGCLRAFRDDQPNPVNQRHPWLAQRLLQIAELEMRVAIHESWEERHIAEVHRFRRIGSSPDVVNPSFAIDCHHAMLDRRPVDRINKSSLKGERHNFDYEKGAMAT